MRRANALYAFLGGCGVAVAFASDLAAQERTPQAAHQFLQKMWDDRPQQIRLSRFTGAEEETTDNSLSESVYGYRGSGCESRFASRTPNAGQVSTTINWRRVSQVRRSERNLRYVEVYGGSMAFSSIGFRLPSEADTERVATAMEFLRGECAPSSAF